MKNLKTKVKEELERNPQARDSDAILVYKIWQGELKEKGLDDSISIALALSLMSTNQISKNYSIERARRLCQQEYPSTRGDAYIARMDKAERAREDIGEIIN